MKIAILTNAFPPLSRGGAGRIADVQADWLVRHDYEVKVWTPEPFPKTEGHAPVEAFKPRTSVPFAKLSKSNPLTRLFFHLEDLAPNLKAVDQIRAWKPDVLITHNLTGCGWGTPRILKDSGIRWIHLLHDVQMFEPSGQLLANLTPSSSLLFHKRESQNLLLFKRRQEELGSLRSLWHSFWSSRRAKAFGQPDLVISPSQWLLDEHKKHGLLKDTKTQVLPNPVEIPRGFCENTISEELRVVCNARLAEDKGIQVLLDAWCSFEPRLGTLELISDGPMMAKIKKLEDSSIKVYGQLPHEEAMVILSSANLLVMPSIIMENQPTVLLEAIAAGVNVVASNVGGVREMLQGYGTLVPPGDSTALAKAIKATLNQSINPQIREQIIARHNVDEVMGEMTHIFII